MKNMKSRLSGLILLILAAALIVTGVFAAKAGQEGTPLNPAFTAALDEQAALAAAGEAVTNAEEDLARTLKRAKDAVEASSAAVESAQLAVETEAAGSYDAETDVGRLGQSIIEAQNSGIDVSGILKDYAPVHNADVADDVAGAEKEVSRAEGAIEDAIASLQAAAEAALALDADAELPANPALAAVNAPPDGSLTGAAALLSQAQSLHQRSEAAQLNADTLNAEGAAILDAVNAVITANPVSTPSKLVTFANARAVDLMSIGAVLLIAAALLLLAPAWLAKKWKNPMFRKGFWFVIVVALLAAALHYANGEMWDLMRQGVFDTLYMTIPATFFAYVLGLPLGVLLVITQPGHIRPNATLNNAVGTVVNFLRSIPFIILLVMLFDVTRLVMGSAIGTRAVIFPLFVSAFPYVARIVEGSLNEVDHGVIEAAESMGSTTWQIIRKVLIPEAMPSLINGAAICMTTILAYTAMAGSAGGDGLGKIAITYGLNYREYDIMYISSLLLVALVQIIQIGGGILMRAVDHRKK